MAASDFNWDNLIAVDGTFNYVGEDEDRPTYYQYEPEPGKPAPLPGANKRTMPVRDIGQCASLATLDGNGFACVEDAPPELDWLNSESVKSTYYPLCTDLVMDTTGAESVYAFDHNIRDRSKENVQDPVRFVHNDYTEASAPQRVRDLFSAAEAERRLNERYAFINVWRPLEHPAHDFPLAICDAGSLEMPDFVATDLKYRDRVGEIYSVRHEQRHRWLYIRGMNPNQVYLQNVTTPPQMDARVTRRTRRSNTPMLTRHCRPA